jgi:phosphonate transport system substrate-binding protein
MLASAVAAGDIRSERYRSIYKSGSFPPLCLGVAHDLPPNVIAQVKKVLDDFRFEGTSLAKRFGPQGKVRFAAVNYKRDWTQVREINDALARLIDSR